MVVFLAESGQAQMQTLITSIFASRMPGSEGTARRVAETCEVFPTLAAAYNYYDDFRTIHVLVLDTSDQLGNGWADYYSNTMAIWATNLDMELRGTRLDQKRGNARAKSHYYAQHGPKKVALPVCPSVGFSL